MQTPPVSPEQILDLTTCVEQGVISGRVAKDVKLV